MSKKGNRNVVSVARETWEALKLEQNRAFAQTGVEPTLDQLVSAALAAYLGKPLAPAPVVKQIPDSKEVRLFREFLANADHEAVNIVLNLLKYSGFRKPPAEGLDRDLAKG